MTVKEKWNNLELGKLAYFKNDVRKKYIVKSLYLDNTNPKVLLQLQSDENVTIKCSVEKCTRCYE